MGVRVEWADCAAPVRRLLSVIQRASRSTEGNPLCLACALLFGSTLSPDPCCHPLPRVPCPPPPLQSSESRRAQAYVDDRMEPLARRCGATWAGECAYKCAQHVLGVRMRLVSLTSPAGPHPDPQVRVGGCQEGVGRRGQQAAGKAVGTSVGVGTHRPCASRGNLVAPSFEAFSMCTC